jgi:hypothetical protein
MSQEPLLPTRETRPQPAWNFIGVMIQFPQTLAIRNTTKVQWADRMDSIKRENRSMHSGRTLDRSRTVAKENDSCPLRLWLTYLSSIA